MNKISYIMILAAVLASGCVAPDGTLSKNDFSGTNLSSSRTVVLTVHGLSCPLCSNNLTGQLKKISGVDGAGIDLNTGAVTVNLAEGHTVTAADLAGAVKNAGFTLKEINPKGPGQ
jgi:copper chaperone CopZ